MDINESPVYVLLNPLINPAQKDLPITIYESGMSAALLSYYVYELLWALPISCKPRIFPIFWITYDI